MKRCFPDLVWRFWQATRIGSSWSIESQSWKIRKKNPFFNLSYFCFCRLRCRKQQWQTSIFKVDFNLIRGDAPPRVTWPRTMYLEARKKKEKSSALSKIWTQNLLITRCAFYHLCATNAFLNTMWLRNEILKFRQKKNFEEEIRL